MFSNPLSHKKLYLPKQVWETAHNNKVYLRTCALDHKYALRNYLARGFSIEKEEIEQKEIPDATDSLQYTPNYYKSLKKGLKNEIALFSGRFWGS